MHTCARARARAYTHINITSRNRVFIYNKYWEAEEIPQWLKLCADHPENLSSALSTHVGQFIITYNSSSRDSNDLFQPLCRLRHMYMHKIKTKNYKLLPVTQLFSLHL